MNGSLSFHIDALHFARQLDLDADRWEIAALGTRCADYLRLAAGGRFNAGDAPRVFPGMLRPSRVPAERSVILGLYTRTTADGYLSTHLSGVLYFLHPHPRGDTWFITLLLLEPAARGKGLGAAVHGAFQRWAVIRGASRFVVSVSEKNPRAGHFWRDRMGYQEIHPSSGQPPGDGTHRELERWLHDAPVAVPWGVPAASERREE